jgi:hypothetical protein
MSILSPSDFTGQFAITKTFDNPTKIQEYIDKVEIQILNELFGVDLYADYLIGIGEITPDPIWTKLRDPFTFQSNCGKVHTSEGLRTLLLCITYATYYHEERSTPTSTGKTVLRHEGGDRATIEWDTVYSVYNRGIKTYQAIQEYISENMDDYSNYKGVNKKRSWLL